MGKTAKNRRRAEKRDEKIRNYKDDHPTATLDDIVFHYRREFSRETVRLALLAGEPNGTK